MVEVKGRQQRETEGQLPAHSCLMLVERTFASLSLQLEGPYVGASL